MGNKLGRKRQVVDDKYTRPQGLYASKDVDIKKLRKLILESKLAPCFPGDEDCCNDLEECPICFLYYPSLNRSRCCTKSICTECFLQMKNPNSARPTQCPFCKTSNYAVEYRGVKTKEEKGIEQIEEQRVIEAKIRMRQKELQDEEERIQKRLESCSSSASAVTAEVETAAPLYGCPGEDGEMVSCQDAVHASTVRQPSSIPRENRDDEFDVDLEDIMVMEAIWLSIQETGLQKSTAYGEITSPGQYVSEDRYVSSAMAPVVVGSSSSSSSSPSAGLACAIAALAERRQRIEEFPNSNTNLNTIAASYNMLPGASTSYYSNIDRDLDDDSYPSAETTVHGSVDMAESGTTSYASSDTSEDSGGEISEEVSGSFQDLPPPPPVPRPLLLVPESYEEQMMMAMAVSLAEGHATTSAPAPTGVTWQ